MLDATKKEWEEQTPKNRFATKNNVYGNNLQQQLEDEIKSNDDVLKLTRMIVSVSRAEEERPHPWQDAKDDAGVIRWYRREQWPLRSSYATSDSRLPSLSFSNMRWHLGGSILSTRHYYSVSDDTPCRAMSTCTSLLPQQTLHQNYPRDIRWNHLPLPNPFSSTILFN